jgi:hypothetical protein
MAAPAPTGIDLTVAEFLDAAAYGDLPMMKILVRRYTSRSGNPPFHLLMARGKGTKPDSGHRLRARMKFTPLGLAACRGRTAVVEYLLSFHGRGGELDLNAGASGPITGNWSPLHLACKYSTTSDGRSRYEIIKLLLEAGADVNSVDAQGETPMYEACRTLGCNSLDNSIRLLVLLSSYGANRTFHFSPGARTMGNSAEAVLQNRFDFHDRDAYLFPVLDVGCKWLAETRGWSPLHHLATMSLERARVLLSGGADVHQVDEAGETPLDRAKAMCGAFPMKYAGTAAHLVLEWGAPWKRATHKFYPEVVRARVAVFMRIAQAIRRGKAAYKGRTRHALFPYAHPASISDVFESTIIPYLIAAETWGDGDIEAKA